MQPEQGMKFSSTNELRSHIMRNFRVGVEITYDTTLCEYVVKKVSEGMNPIELTPDAVKQFFIRRKYVRLA